MKTILTAALFALAAFAPVRAQDVVATRVDLSQFNHTTSLLAHAGAGIVQSIACRVVAPVANASAVLTFMTDGKNETYKIVQVYGYSGEFADVVLPFQTLGSLSTPGMNIGDTFVLPLGLKYSTRMQIQMWTFGGTGALSCSLIRTDS